MKQRKRRGRRAYSARLVEDILLKSDVILHHVVKGNIRVNVSMTVRDVFGQKLGLGFL